VAIGVDSVAAGSGEWREEEEEVEECESCRVEFTTEDTEGTELEKAGSCEWNRKSKMEKRK
jgi:hypothetical protein